MLWLFKINFHGSRRFLIHGNSSYVVLYTQCLRYNICSTWFLDIRISTCFSMHEVANVVCCILRGWIKGVSSADTSLSVKYNKTLEALPLHLYASIQLLVRVL